MDDSSANLHRQAIAAALSLNWEEALNLNQQILELDPKNVEALNRLARTHFELGNLTKSKEYSEEALKIDPYNQIAAKFLKRIEAYRKQGSKDHSLPLSHPQIDGDLFLEEPGKTKLVPLLKVAEPQKLSLLSPGLIVNLVAKNRGITVTDQNGSYLGVLPDDLSHHLERLMRGGNKYQAIIKNIKLNSLSLLIRETFRCARFKNQPSFLDNTNANFAYSSDNIIVPTDTDEEPLLESLEEDSA